MTPNTVPSTFHWHQLCNTDRKTFSFLSLSLSSNGFPIACFLSFLLKNKITHEKRAQQRITHCVNTDLASVPRSWFREIGDIVVRTLDERRVIIHHSILVGLLGLKTYERKELGQVAKQLDLGRNALDQRFQVGKVLQEGVRGPRGRSREWSSKWSSRNSRSQDGRNMRR